MNPALLKLSNIPESNLTHLKLKKNIMTNLYQQMKRKEG